MEDNYEGFNVEMEGKYLTFWTDQQLYGIPIASLMMLVVDVRVRFKKEPIEKEYVSEPPCLCNMGYGGF